jgi:hypothetical protein
MASSPAGKDGRAGREEGRARVSRAADPRCPACPAEAETRQRLLRTVKKEVGAGHPMVGPAQPGDRGSYRGDPWRRGGHLGGCGLGSSLGVQVGVWKLRARCDAAPGPSRWEASGGAWRDPTCGGAGAWVSLGVS